MKRYDRQRKRALHTDTKAWRLLRQQVLVRDLYRCQACKRMVTGPDAHVDHIHDDAHDPDSNQLDRLQTLCRECHGAKTRAEMDGRKWDGMAGPRACDADGWPV